MNISRRKNRPPGFLFTAPVLNLPATIMLLPKPKVSQETHMVFCWPLHVAKYLYRDSRPALSSTQALV